MLGGGKSDFGQRNGLKPDPQTGCRSVTRGVTWGQNAVFSGNENQGTARRALSRAFRNWSYFYCARPWERARRAQSSEKGNFEAPKRVVGGAQLPVCWLCVGKLGRGFTLVPFFIQAAEIQVPSWAVPGRISEQKSPPGFSRFDLFGSLRVFAISGKRFLGELPKLHQGTLYLFVALEIR